MTPIDLKNQEIGLKTGSRIMNQPKELSAVGTIQGIITARPDWTAEAHAVAQGQGQPQPQHRFKGTVTNA